MTADAGQYAMVAPAAPAAQFTLLDELGNIPGELRADEVTAGQTIVAGPLGLSWDVLAAKRNHNSADYRSVVWITGRQVGGTWVHTFMCEPADRVKLA